MPATPRPCNTHLELVARISVAAEKAGVNVFRRFALLQHWVDHDKIAIKELVHKGDPNKLHMSDWATNCVTQALFGAIKQAVGTDGIA
jgi:acyl-CoA thioesterase-1